MVEGLAALSKAVMPTMSGHDVSIVCILAERSSGWRRHREGFSEVMGDPHLCQDAVSKIGAVRVEVLSKNCCPRIKE